MTPSITALFLVVVSFAATFIVARALGKKYRARRALRTQQAARLRQSRQVRRANDRKAPR